MLDADIVINCIHDIILSHMSDDEDKTFTETDHTLLTVNKEICEAIRFLSDAQEKKDAK